MWKGYGSLPATDTGIKLSLRESYPSKTANRNSADNLTGSLLEACGFQAIQKTIGDIAESKWISEAVVAIPFLDIEGERKFFALGNTMAQSRDIFLRALTGEEGPGKSIVQLANKMPRYVFPPHLDFLNDSGIEPFAAYIFEFSHQLSQQDLSNIWQNMMPDIAVTAEKSTSTLSHGTGENEFFRGNKLPDNTRWMVFKIKQKAAIDYFKMTADATDDHRFRFNFNDGAELDYSYNWPYDFFSLVELAKIDVKVGIGEDAFPVRPIFTPTINPMVINPISLNLGTSSPLPILAFQPDTGLRDAEAAAKLAAAGQLGASSPLGGLMQPGKQQIPVGQGATQATQTEGDE